MGCITSKKDSDNNAQVVTKKEANVDEDYLQELKWYCLSKGIRIRLSDNLDKVRNLLFSEDAGVSLKYIIPAEIVGPNTNGDSALVILSSNWRVKVMIAPQDRFSEINVLYYGRLDMIWQHIPRNIEALNNDPYENEEEIPW